MSRNTPGYNYPINTQLCIYPTEPYDEQETQFEAFQSVLARMLSADDGSPYVVLATLYGLNVEEINLEGVDYVLNLPDGVYYRPAYMGSTHYLGVRDGRVYDPYDYFQPPHTQGFCQMFAFFLAVGDVRDFQRVGTQRSTSLATLEKYTHNTYTALRKLLALLDTHRELDMSMRNSFQRLNRAEYGIRCRTYDRFKNDLALLTVSDVRFYIIDNPLPGDTRAQQTRLMTYALGRS